jgi:hypothetical protein
MRGATPVTANLEARVHRCVISLSAGKVSISSVKQFALVFRMAIRADLTLVRTVTEARLALHVTAAILAVILDIAFTAITVVALALRVLSALLILILLLAFLVYAVFTLAVIVGSTVGTFVLRHAVGAEAERATIRAVRVGFDSVLLAAKVRFSCTLSVDRESVATVRAGVGLSPTDDSLECRRVADGRVASVPSVTPDGRTLNRALVTGDPCNRAYRHASTVCRECGSAAAACHGGAHTVH